MTFREMVLAGVACAMLIALTLKWRRAQRQKKDRYIGFGWSLGWRKEDGSIVVADVLSGGPAHQAGVTPGLIVNMYDGTPMCFKNAAEFKRLLDSRRPWLGETSTFQLVNEQDEVGTVTLAAD